MMQAELAHKKMREEINRLYGPMKWLMKEQLTTVAEAGVREGESQIRESLAEVMKGAEDRREYERLADSLRVRRIGKGGTVRPTGRISDVTGKPTRSLLIPFDDSPLRKTRQTLKEWAGTKQIRVIKSRNGCPILIATEEKKTRTNITWLGKLVKQAHHKPRPEVMPDSDTLSAALAQGAKQSVKHLLAKHAKQTQ